MIQHHTHVKPVLASALVGGAKLPHLHLRTCEFHAGTREICAVAREFCAGACELCAVARELCAGTRELCAGTRELCAGARELCAGARELCAGAREFCASAGEFCAARSKIYLDLPWFLGRCCANSWADLRSSFSSFHVHAPLRTSRRPPRAPRRCKHRRLRFPPTRTRAKPVAAPPHAAAGRNTKHVCCTPARMGSCATASPCATLCVPPPLPPLSLSWVQRCHGLRTNNEQRIRRSVV